jgi:hypothetical protein
MGECPGALKTERKASKGDNLKETTRNSGSRSEGRAEVGTIRNGLPASLLTSTSLGPMPGHGWSGSLNPFVRRQPYCRLGLRFSFVHIAQFIHRSHVHFALRRSAAILHFRGDRIRCNLPLWPRNLFFKRSLHIAGTMPL